MEPIVGPSPCHEILLSRYDEGLFPKFKQVFSPDAPRLMACDPEERSAALVVENRDVRNITALRYRWLKTGESGKVYTHQTTNDSYMVAVFRPVIQSGDRMLITLSRQITESILDHMNAGGGVIGGGAGFANAGASNSDPIVALRFEVDMLLFEDGEVCGPDPDRFAAQLVGRKVAGKYVASQVRRAISEGRDPQPVIRALFELPHRREDGLGSFIVFWAGQLLHSRSAKGDIDLREGHLRWMEDSPKLPHFYRKDGRDIGAGGIQRHVRD